MGKLGCIGYGAMGSALIAGFVSAGFSTRGILVYDTSSTARDKAKQQGFLIADDLGQLEECDYVLLAVKPQQLETVAASWKQERRDQVVISILAGVDTKTLRAALNREKIIRVMPNLPAQIGRGVIAVHFPGEISDDEKQFVLGLLQKTGKVFEIREELFNAVTALSGSGPAFVLLILEAFAQAGVMEGLDFRTALDMAVETMVGTAEHLKAQKMHPAELRDMVTSPKGTTAAGLLVLEDEATRASIIKGIRAAAERSRQLQEGK